MNMIRPVSVKAHARSYGHASFRKALASCFHPRTASCRPCAGWCDQGDRRELALLHFLCKQPSEKGRLILIFGAIPPPRNFAKIRTRGGRGLLPVQPKDSIPPWDHTGARRARRGWFAPESSGRREQNGCTQRGLCRVSGHLCDRGGGRAKKPVFAL